MCTVDVHLKRSKNLIDFLVKYDTLAVSHQNQAATSGIFPGLPESWITWAKRGSNSWRDIVRVYQSDASSLEFKVRYFLHLCFEGFWRCQSRMQALICHQTWSRLYRIVSLFHSQGNLSLYQERVQHHQSAWIELAQKRFTRCSQCPLMCRQCSIRLQINRE